MAGKGKRKDRYTEQEPPQDEDGSRNNVSGFINSYPPHRHSHDQAQTSGNMINGSVHVVANHQHSFNTLNLKPDEPGPFGLKLGKTTCLAKHVLKQLSTQEKRHNKHEEEGSSQKQPAHNKVKPSSFPAVFLKIGTWSWESKNEQDLVVKFYYQKRKLVWEFLYGSLKKKIEIRWAHLSAIQASVDEDQKERLEIELQQPPEYYNETGFKAKIHTKWTATHDFTGDWQATFCRRHTILFSPGVLDEHFKKLVESDGHLSNLNQKPFPFHNSPFFYNSILDYSNKTNAFGGPPIPLRYQDHNGTVVPYVQNLDQPTSSFNGHSGCNLPITMAGPMLHNPDDVATKVLDLEQITMEQSEIDEILEILSDDYVPYNGVASPIPHYLADVMENTCSIVDSACKPSMQNQHNNSNPSGNGKTDGSHHFSGINLENYWLVPMLPNSNEIEQNFDADREQSGNNQIQEISLPPIGNQDDHIPFYGMDQHNNSFPCCINGTNFGQSHINSGIAFIEENYQLPFQARMDDSSSVGGAMNDVDDEIFSFNEQPQLMNDGTTSQEPSSWLHSQVNNNMHAFDNGGNGELPLQGFNNGGNGSDHGGNGEPPLQGIGNANGGNSNFYYDGNGGNRFEDGGN